MYIYIYSQGFDFRGGDSSVGVSKSKCIHHGSSSSSSKIPMDTIFVKSVKEGGAAYAAGLRIGTLTE